MANSCKPWNFVRGLDFPVDLVFAAQSVYFSTVAVSLLAMLALAVAGMTFGQRLRGVVSLALAKLILRELRLLRTYMAIQGLTA